MARKLTDQVRHCVDKSELSRYAIGTLAKIDHGALSRFMAGNGGLSLDSLDRLAEALGLVIVVEVPKRKGKKMSTQAGYVNQQGQRVLSRVGPSPSHPNQYNYEMECSHCGTHYGANGCDIDGANAGAGRRCPSPNCQNGTPGNPI
jgi:hypothetical protein